MSEGKRTDTVNQSNVMPGDGELLPETHELVDYIAQYGGRCRDCADEVGICPGSGLPCDNATKAIRHVLKAINYGVANGYLPDPRPPVITEVNEAGSVAPEAAPPVDEISDDERKLWKSLTTTLEVYDIDVVKMHHILGKVQNIASLLRNRPADDDEMYEIGKRDGYEEAIQEIDVATGGDGEFYGSTFPGETVDVPVMRQRIIDRVLDATPSPVLALEAEPVAWARFSLGDVTRDKERVDEWVHYQFDVTPLYPAPPASPVQVKVKPLAWTDEPDARIIAEMDALLASSPLPAGEKDNG